MKKTLLFTFTLICTVSFSFAQTAIPIENADFEAGVDATTWATARVSADSLTPIIAEVKNGWRVLSSSTFEGVVDIQSASTNASSGGALRLDASVPGAFTGSAKLESSRHQFVTNAEVTSFDINLSFFAYAGAQASGNRVKTFLNYKIGEDAYVNQSFANAVGRFKTGLTEFTEHGGVQTFTPAAPIPSGTIVEFYLEFRFGKTEIEPEKIAYLDDVSISIAGSDFELTTLGTDDIASDVVRIFPNPVKDNLNFSNNDVKTVSVFNLLGQKVIEKTITSSLDVTALPKGIYLLQLKKQNESGIISKKFVKN